MIIAIVSLAVNILILFGLSIHLSIRVQRLEAQVNVLIACESKRIRRLTQDEF